MRQEQVTLAGRTVPYTLTISRRARQARLTIAPETGLRVVVPLGFGASRLLALLLRRQRWILTHLDRIAALPAPPDATTPLPDHLPFLGVEHAVHVTVAPGTRPDVEQGAQSLTVRVPDEAQARATLEGWLRRAARDAIVARVEARAAEMGVTYQHLAIRDQKTRWGSCSSAGGLNFNWRLVLAPPAVLDYVVVHELAHRVELNHSPRFWCVVARYCPAYDASRAWLRTHGATLRFSQKRQRNRACTIDHR